MKARESRPLALTMSAMRTPKRVAIAETVSPAATVYDADDVVDFFDVVLVFLGADVVVVPGIVSFWPTRMEARESRPLALTMSAMRTPKRVAIAETVSPAATV